jgi:hypothetical protein
MRGAPASIAWHPHRLCPPSRSPATTKIGMANLIYNIKRFIFLRKIAVA